MENRKCEYDYLHKRKLKYILGLSRIEFFRPDLDSGFYYLFSAGTGYPAGFSDAAGFRILPDFRPPGLACGRGVSKKANFCARYNFLTYFGGFW